MKLVQSSEAKSWAFKKRCHLSPMTRKFGGKEIRTGKHFPDRKKINHSGFHCVSQTQKAVTSKAVTYNVT